MLIGSKFIAILGTFLGVIFGGGDLLCVKDLTFCNSADKMNIKCKEVREDLIFGMFV